jgi:hypothetical protein
MKQNRAILFTVSFAVAIFSVVLYSACNKNKCHDVLCLNQGVCDGGSCVCPVGFEGPRCATLTRDKFIFTYRGGDTCGADPSSMHYTPYQIHLLAVLHDSLEMTLKNFINNMEDSAICTIQSTDSFTFQGANNSTTYYGWGKLSNDSLWLRYHVVHDTTSYDCSYFGQGLR